MRFCLPAWGRAGKLYLARGVFNLRSLLFLIWSSLLSLMCLIPLRKKEAFCDTQATARLWVLLLRTSLPCVQLMIGIHIGLGRPLTCPWVVPPGRCQWVEERARRHWCWGCPFCVCVGVVFCLLGLLLRRLLCLVVGFIVGGSAPPQGPQGIVWLFCDRKENKHK